MEEIARGVRRSGRDAKWQQLAGLLGEILPSGAKAPSTDLNKPPQKLVIFTEHRDTLAYLRGRTLEQAVVIIHGGWAARSGPRRKKRSATTRAC